MSFAPVLIAVFEPLTVAEPLDATDTAPLLTLALLAWPTRLTDTPEPVAVRALPLPEIPTALPAPP